MKSHDIEVKSDGNLCHTPVSFVCLVSVIDGRIQSLSMQIVWQRLRFTGTFAILEETNGVGVGAGPQENSKLHKGEFGRTSQPNPPFRVFTGPKSTCIKNMFSPIPCFTPKYLNV